MEQFYIANEDYANILYITITSGYYRGEYILISQ